MTWLERRYAWNVQFDGLVIAGGRLRTGFPLPGAADFGTGRENRYIGADLAALLEIRKAGFVGFFELPHELRGTGLGDSRERCDWTFQVAGRRLALPALVDLVFVGDSPWKVVPQALVNQVGLHGARVFRVSAQATSGPTGPVDVELVFIVDEKARSDLYVSTTKIVAGDAAAEEALVRLAAREVTRHRPGSKIECSARELLERGWLQRNQRRRFPERRSFAAVAQTAYGVLALARNGVSVTAR